MPAKTLAAEISPETLLSYYPPAVQQIAQELRQLVKEVCPSALEKAYSGWRIVGFSAPRIFCYIAPSASHVALGFNMGKSLPDPSGLLGGEARNARSVLLEPGKRIPRKAIRELVQQAYALSQWSVTPNEPEA